MTRIQILSDLHLESQPDFRAVPAPNVDVLVLAGDIGSYQNNSKLLESRVRDFGLGQFAATSHGGQWAKVIYVPGNHEYDAGDFDTLHHELRIVAESLGITWLERETHIHDGVRFVGTTLWTDFDALTDGLEPAAQTRERTKAFRAANHYLANAAMTWDSIPVRAEQWRELGLNAQRWLRKALASKFDGSTVVVTHFAPSLRSADPRYGVTPGTAGFCSNLEDLFCGVDLWIHGHLHCRNDYYAGTGRPCRVVSNPLGYERKGEQHSFDPFFVVEIK